jgi:FlaA1/EpsC-like NDP-sugar epimerase
MEYAEHQSLFIDTVLIGRTLLRVFLVGRWRAIIKGTRNRHLLALDMLTALLVPAVSLFLRLESVEEVSLFAWPLAFYTGAAILWKLAVFHPTGLYNRYWRYASVDALATVCLATLASLLAGNVVFFGVMRPLGIIPDGFPRSVPVLDGIITMVVVGGARFMIRLGAQLLETKAVPERTHNVIVVGAGAAGSLIVKEMRSNPQLGLRPVGFVDDDPRKGNVRIHGVPVLGQIKNLSAVLGRQKVGEVIIAMPTAPGKVIREVVEMCKLAGVRSKTVPGLFEILEGTAKVQQMRDVELEDLLRRGKVHTDIEEVSSLIQGATVLVTGAGGSIGGELCRQIKALKPSNFVLLGHGENSLFTIAGELQKTGTSDECAVHTVVADLRDQERMKSIFRLFRPDIVFHTAAHKHVGLMEVNLPDAVTNNVLGTMLLVDAAAEFGTKKLVMISSDKAVNPTNIMGATKRVAELIVREAAERTGRAFVSVRFGNVLGSRGSVVPIFKQQIANGGPITITDPDATRFFMTIPEAVQLVLQAAAMGAGAEVFVLDMGEPLRVIDVARDMIRLSGLEEGRDIEIEVVGLKPGEKMHEELFFDHEKPAKSKHEKVLVCHHGHNGTPPEGWGESLLRRDIDRLIHFAQKGRLYEARQVIKKIVPEYHYDIKDTGKEEQAQLLEETTVSVS